MSTEKFVCDYAWTHFEVNNPNGDVTMCCDNDMVLGNVKKNTIREIWNGKGYQKVRHRMAEEGAHAICPHTCSVLQGGKSYQNLDWHSSLEKENPARINAEINDLEYAAAAVELESLPRWMRFTYSYACNLDCYHCYQREDATQTEKLPTDFMTEMSSLSAAYQVVLPFGGEPFLFRPVLDFLETKELSPGCQYYFVTNATLLTERVRKVLESKEILVMAVSLDAATEENFDKLRVRGRNAAWGTVVDTLNWLKELKKVKDFIFITTMTVNSENYMEIESFVDLSLERDAQPLAILVGNPYQTLEFQRNFLCFTDAQFDSMFQQIDQCLPKIRERGFKDAETAIEILRKNLQRHRTSENKVSIFTAKSAARKVLRILPEQMQAPLKTLVQKARTRKLNR